jgi:arylsulfatase A-like enzyme
MRPEPPNIILIHWHDTGRHLGAYGVAGVRSDNVDRLATQGTRFDAAFATAPLCSPARGSIFTGRYPHSNGLMGLAHLGWEYNANERTLPMLLRDRDYRSILVGVQHESADATGLGYDEVLNVNGTRQFAPAVAEIAIDRLRELAEDTSPFLMVIGMFEPHRPYPASRYATKSSDSIEVPPYLPDTPGVREDLAGFRAAIEYADEATGRVLDVIDATGLSRNTIVIFTTDHGIPFPRAKSTLYDAGIEVALIVRMPPGAAAPASCSDPVSHVDLVPTLLDLVGAETPAYVQGQSFAAALLGGEVPPREIFAEKNWHDTHQYDPIRAVRTTRHKYIRNYEERPAIPLPGDIARGAAAQDVDGQAPRASTELYDLLVDPNELNNVVGIEEYASVERELSERLLAWQHATADPLLQGPIQAARITNPLAKPRGHRTQVIEPQFVQGA